MLRFFATSNKQRLYLEETFLIILLHDDNSVSCFPVLGICEPWDIEKCREINGADWDFCARPVYECNDTKAAGIGFFPNL